MAVQFEVSKSLADSDMEKPVLPAGVHDCIQMPNGSNFLDLQVMDSTEQVWTLRYYTRPHGDRRCPVLTKGWKAFARAKRLQVGDKLIFSGHQVRSADGQLRTQYKIQVTRPNPDFTFQGEPVYMNVETFL